MDTRKTSAPPIFIFEFDLDTLVNSVFPSKFITATATDLNIEHKVEQI